VDTVQAHFDQTTLLLADSAHAKQLDLVDVRLFASNEDVSEVNVEIGANIP